MGLGFLFTAKNLASGHVKGLRNDFTGLRTDVDKTRASFTRNMTAMGTGLAGMAAGGLLLGAQFKLAKAAGEFEQGLAAVGAVTRATTLELKSLEDTAIKAGIATQFSPKEAVEGLTSLATAGQSAAQATETLIPVLDLAAGSLGQLGVAQAAEAVVGTLNAYGLAAGDAAIVTDKLLRVTQLTNFQARDFSVGLAKAAAAGGLFGQSIEDTLLVVGQLRNMNIDASSASTAYREATRRLASDQNAQNAVTGKGVDIYDKQTKKIRSLVDVMQDLNVKLAASTDEERNAVVARAFGARGLMAFSAIARATATKVLPDGTKQILKGVEAIKFLREELTNAGDTAAEFKDRLLDTFEGQMTLARGSVQTFTTVVGQDMALALRPAVEGFIKVINRMIESWQALPDSTKAGIANFIRIAGVTMVAGGAMIFLSGAIPLLLRGLGALRAVALVTAGSLLRIAAPIAVVVGAALLIKKAYEENLGGFADWIDGVVGRVRLAWDGLVQLFTQGGFSGAIREELGKAENAGIKQFVIGVGMLATRFRAMWDGAMEGMASAWEAARPSLVAFGNAFGGVLDAVERVFTALVGGRSAVTSSSASWKSFGKTIMETVGKAFNFIADSAAFMWGLVEQIFNGMASVFEGMGSPIDDLVSGFGHIWGAVEGVVGIFDSLLGGTGSLKETLSGLASFLGKVVGVAVKGIAIAFDTVAAGIEGVIGFVKGVINYFKKLKDAIWKDFPGVAKFFDETLPAAFKKMYEWLQEWVIEPIVSFGQEVARVFKAAIDKISKVVAGIIMKMPASYLPDELVEWAKANRAIESTPEYNWWKDVYMGKYAPEGSIKTTKEQGAEFASTVTAMRADPAMARLVELLDAQAEAKGLEIGKSEIVIKVGEEELARVSASIDRSGRMRNLEQEPLGAE